MLRKQANKLLFLPLKEDRCIQPYKITSWLWPIFVLGKVWLPRIQELSPAADNIPEKTQSRSVGPSWSQRVHKNGANCDLSSLPARHGTPRISGSRTCQGAQNAGWAEMWMRGGRLGALHVTGAFSPSSHGKCQNYTQASWTACSQPQTAAL